MSTKTKGIPIFATQSTLVDQLGYSEEMMQDKLPMAFTRQYLSDVINKIDAKIEMLMIEKLEIDAMHHQDMMSQRIGGMRTVKNMLMESSRYDDDGDFIWPTDK